MYYKAVDVENHIIDVYTDDELLDSYVTIDPSLNIPIRCRASDSYIGILASDSSVIYSLENQTGNYPLVTLHSFTGRGEYDSLRAAIDEQRQIDYEEEESDQDDSTLPDRVPSRAELQEQIDMLTECILEMSEIIYGE